MVIVMNKLLKHKYILLLIPSLSGLIVFWIWPSVYNVKYMFEDGKAIENIQYLLTNEYFCTAIVNTFLFTVIAAPMAIFLALVIAILTYKFAQNIPFIRKAYFLPIVLPSAVIVTIWQIFFSDVAPFRALIAIYLWKYSGMYYVIILTAIASLNSEMFEAAYVDGANDIQAVVYLMLPCIIPTLFFTLALAIVNSFKIFRESFLLYGGYPETEVYMYQNFINNHFYKLNYQYISTAAVLLALLIHILVAVLLFTERRWSGKIW